LSKKKVSLARYESIALDIAHQIVQGKYPIGTRLSGRTTLSSMYRVSPETIRKSMVILEQYGVVRVQHGSGIYVVSSENASTLLKEYDYHQDLQKVVDHISEIMERQQYLMKEMKDALDTLIELTRRD
jgi:DNA-binding GntR family transcriptional regulator